MNRRAILIGGAASAALAATLLLARVHAQTRSYRLAILSAQSEAGGLRFYREVFATLEKLGYLEGKNLVVERRFAGGRLERLPALAAELVALKPDVILAAASQPALAASKATGTIPIVFVAVSDPVGIGVVRSLAPWNQRDGAQRTEHRSALQAAAAAEGSLSRGDARRRTS
jgi:putative ABC transport system substrate-binding protein